VFYFPYSDAERGKSREQGLSEMRTIRPQSVCGAVMDALDALTILDGLRPTVGGFLGGFLGAWTYFYFWCPNHRCCQLKKVRQVLEEPVKIVKLEE